MQINPHAPRDDLGAAHRVGPNRTCIACGGPLTLQQAVSGKVCDRLTCKGPYLQQLKAVDTARRRAARLAVAEQVRHRLGLFHQPLVVVPANLHRCVPLSPERLESFRSHLRRVIADAQPPRTGACEAPAAPEARPQEELPQFAVIHSCTTCRGRCCLGGAGHAFLRGQTIAEFWQRHPSLSHEAIEAEYLEHVAPHGFADSCVYHSESGCTLPRTMRADICNTFLCEGLLEGLEAGPDLSLYIAADGAKVHRAVLVDTDGRREELLSANPPPDG